MPNTIGGGLIDRSLSVLTASSTTVMEANKGRQYLLLVNNSANDIWVDLQGGTAASGALGCIKLIASTGYFEMVGPFVSTSKITARAVTGDSNLTAFEG